MSEAVEHEVIIEPSRGWPLPRWRELWEYRDLLRMLVARDFSARYRQTLLGPLWFIVQPLLTAAMFTLVFSKMAGIETDHVPAPLFYLCGLLGWGYFAQTIAAGGMTFMTNSHLFSKVYFPRVVVPASTAVSNLCATALQIVPLAGFFLYYKFGTPYGSEIHMGWSVLLFVPLAIAHLVLLAFGFSLWMSAATAKFRDLGHLIPFVVQLWMFGSPVFYPMSKWPDAWRWLFWINPVAAPLELLRLGIVGHGTVLFPAMAASVIATLLLVATGLVAFALAERTVTDTA